MASKTLGFYVRTMGNLYRAFVRVRSNVNASGRAEFKEEVRTISENPARHLRRIQRQLKERRFYFDKQTGVPKVKPDGRVRPIVVSSLRNRIVQRAILNVLQSEGEPIASLLGKITEVLQVRTSVGGVPHRGVPCGINIIREAIGAGATHYLRSDIRDFFTRVPKSVVLDFVKSQTSDIDFVDLLEQAIATELQNADEIKELIHLFPLDDIGVPQGSSLSAFAGNVVLRDFDQTLNGRGVTTVRYIDDFVVLGPSAHAVRRAFSSALAALEDLGMTAYLPEDASGKSQIGSVSEGFDFLGCSVGTNGVAPSRDSGKRLLNRVRDVLMEANQAIATLASSSHSRRAEAAYAQALVSIDRIIRGWGDSFAFVDNRLLFHQMDVRINGELKRFRGRANRVINAAASDDQKRRSVGVALLKDTPCRNGRHDGEIS